MSIKGIDVSEFQGVVNWDLVKNSGIQFVMIRAGYGAGNIDNQFLNNATECNHLGIPFGVYWFSYAYTAEMARREAEYCINAVRDFSVQYPVCFDFEQDSVRYAQSRGVTVQRPLATALVEAFCNRVEQLGYFAMYYSNLDYLNRMFDPGLRKKYALWYAQYAASPAIQGMGIWQYSSSGRVNGISGDADLNIGYEDYARIIKEKGFNKGSGTVPRPNPPQNQGESTIIYTVAQGDTLSEIAQRYGVTYQKLAADNGIQDPNLIYPGQKIRIAGGGQGAGTQYYTIRRGDTLSEIAQRYGTSVARLQEINGIPNANLIFAGTTIQV